MVQGRIKVYSFGNLLDDNNDLLLPDQLSEKYNRPLPNFLAYYSLRNAIKYVSNKMYNAVMQLKTDQTMISEHMKHKEYSIL